MQEILDKLCDLFPEALGAAVCDSEGESMAIAMGRAVFPTSALESVEASLPLNFDRGSWTEEESKLFALRQWAAEPSRSASQLRRAYESAGEAHLVEAFSIRAEAVELIVGTLEEHMYLVLILRRPGRSSLGHRAVSACMVALREEFTA